MNSQSHNPQILLLTDDYPPGSGGGIATWAFELSKSLPARGYRLEVLVRRKKPIQEQPPSDNVKVTQVSGRDWNRYRGFYMFWHVLRRLRKQRPLIVIGSTWQHLTFISRLPDWMGIRLICFAHGTDICRFIESNRRVTMLRVLRRVHTFAPVSRFLSKLVEDASSPDVPKTEVVYNGVDISSFSGEWDKRASRAYFKLPEKDPLIISVGRIMPVKGFDTLISALKAVREQHNGAVLLIAGAQKQPEFGKLQALVEDLGLRDAVHFRENVAYADLPRLYACADVFAMASRVVRIPYYQEEGLAMVVLEAAASKLPLVAMRSGGIPEAIEDGKSGFVVQSKDELAERVCQLLADQQLARKMGEAGRVLVESKFSTNQNSENVLRIVERVAGR